MPNGKRAYIVARRGKLEVENKIISESAVASDPLLRASLRLSVERRHCFVLRKDKDPARRGLTAHTAILHKLVSMGFEVLQPLSDDLRYDLAYYVGETAELVRIQCKAGRYDRDKGCIYFNNFSRPGGRGKRHGYIGDAEYFGVYCEELNKVYLVPIDIASYASAVSLRILATKNNQQKKVIWAKDFEI